MQNFRKPLDFTTLWYGKSEGGKKGEEKVMTGSSGGAARKVTNEVTPVIPLDE